VINELNELLEKFDLKGYNDSRVYKVFRVIPEIFDLCPNINDLDDLD